MIKKILGLILIFLAFLLLIGIFISPSIRWKIIYIFIIVICWVAGAMLIITKEGKPSALWRWTKISLIAAALIYSAFILFTNYIAPILPHKVNSSISIIVVPEAPFVDEQMRIIISGLEPYLPITVKAIMKDGRGELWASQAEFKSDENGTADLATQKPISGTYEDADPMGIIWSMEPVDKKTASIYKNDTIKPEDLKIIVEIYGNEVAVKKINRVYMAPGVKRIPISEGGLYGVLFKPAGKGQHPGILILSGSDGGIREDYASLLASRGYNAFALGYFGWPGLPKELAQVRLEYIEKAVKWFKGNPSVSKKGIGIIGRSKGGELSLLSASTFKDIKAVAAYVGSGVVWQSPSRVNMNTPVSSWTYRGKDIPFVPTKASPLYIAKYMLAKATGKPIGTKPMYTEGLKDLSAVKKAVIKVENINGPVLLISAMDDAIWPSTKLSQMAIDRMKKFNHPFSHEHIAYSGCGHSISLPYQPTTVTYSYNPSAGFKLEHGGTPKAEAAAREDSWKSILRFFRENLDNK
ncbi:acyl-CoA thioesterase/bile acid-CoA:amino acid N-acyltransferase family protein [Candidatus Margulisiibacteriota bacterium]